MPTDSPNDVFKQPWISTFTRRAAAFTGSCAVVLGFIANGWKAELGHDRVTAFTAWAVVAGLLTVGLLLVSAATRREPTPDQWASFHRAELSRLGHPVHEGPNVVHGVVLPPPGSDRALPAARAPMALPAGTGPLRSL